MAVGCHRLQDLKESRATKNKEANQQDAAGIGEAEKRSDDGEYNDVLNVGIGLHFRPHQERRELEIDRVNEADMGQRGVGNEDD